jgi:Xaa-Pro aminopeptidase
MENLFQAHHALVGASGKTGKERLHIALPFLVDVELFHLKESLLEVGRFQVTNQQAVIAQKQRVVVPACSGQRLQHFRPNLFVPFFVFFQPVRPDLQEKTNSLHECLNSTMHPPTIPEDEFPRRWVQVQAMMDREKLDLLVAYADDRAVFGPAHARWLANFPVHFEPVGILLFPRGTPVMLCGPETREYALLAGRIADVRILREFTHPNEDYPHTSIQNLREVVGEAVPDPLCIHRIGVAGRGLMSAEIVASFEAAFPQAEWVDVENGMCDVRAQKSPAELAVIRYAYRIAEAGLTAAVNAIQVGVTEREVAAEAEAAMRGLGAEGTGIDTIVASGPNSRPILARSTFRKIQADELVLITVAPRYEGYHAAIGRPVLVGNPGDEIRRAVDVAWQAQEACFHAMRPGIEGRHVEAIGRRIVDDADLGRYFLYSGIHSVGVIEFEPPIFGPSSSALFQPDMVISVDIPLFDAPWGGLRIEDGFLITETGAEKLNHTPYLIVR